VPTRSYAQGTYQLVEQLKVTGGIRWPHDEIQVDDIQKTFRYLPTRVWLKCRIRRVQSPSARTVVTFQAARSVAERQSRPDPG